MNTIFYLCQYFWTAFPFQNHIHWTFEIHNLHFQTKQKNLNKINLVFIPMDHKHLHMQ